MSVEGRGWWWAERGGLGAEGLGVERLGGEGRRLGDEGGGGHEGVLRRGPRCRIPVEGLGRGGGEGLDRNVGIWDGQISPTKTVSRGVLNIQSWAGGACCKKLNCWSKGWSVHVGGWVSRVSKTPNKQFRKSLTGNVLAKHLGRRAWDYKWRGRGDWRVRNVSEEPQTGESSEDQQDGESTHLVKR